MSLTVGQWILLGAGCLQAVVGIYMLVTNRLARPVPFFNRDRLEPRRHGAGQLVASVFPITAVLVQATEWSYELAMATLMLGLVAFLAGTWLMLPTKQPRSSS
ncbi:hypothetical protein AB0J63_04020 [Streptosporangium canum]|uniref:hypothetical protein n=1 Tax=Streptosporangium canum TaxID=324952 RepID=UPI0034190B50